MELTEIERKVLQAVLQESYLSNIADIADVVESDLAEVSLTMKSIAGKAGFELQEE